MSDITHSSVNEPVGDPVDEPVNESANESGPARGSEPVNESAKGALTVSVNGAARVLAAPVTLDVLVATLAPAPSGVAAALNETVVPRGHWSATTLRDGDRVEVLTAVQGG
ncbi:sulfur carrier protein ThiS [Streptomyces sp. NPDC006645]|uniref:sulfur carrier protein ThiS n=1 Tax=unclassified Streptomyces TaxID=2593676 RepID=UPI0033AE7C41